MRRTLTVAEWAWLVALALGLVAGIGMLTHETRDRFWKAEQAHQYLQQPVVKTQDGRTLTRQQLIDLALGEYLQRQQSAAGSGR